MSRLVIFDRLPADSHTYYEDVATGATVQIYPGDRVPARAMLDPEHYVERKMARIEGVEDGSDGRLDRLMAKLRKVFADVAPLSGDPKRWTLADMLTHAALIEAEDAATRKAFEAAAASAEVPTTTEEIQAADAGAPA